MVNTSTVTLYRDCKITPDKSFVVENIQNYLGNLVKFTLSDFQYIQNDLSIEIKVASQTIVNQSIFTTVSTEELLNPRENTHKFNYVSIKNSTDAIPFYYFVTDKRWGSSGTVILELALDSANTFKNGTDYSFTARTQVNREHKDRIYNSTVTYDGQTYYRRKIDFESEGIEPVLFKTSDYKLIEGGDYDWYIMYKADNVQTGQFPPQAVSTYIMANINQSIFGPGVGGFKIDAARMTLNSYYVFGKDITGTQNGSITVNGTTYEISEYMAIRKTSSALEFYKARPVILGDGTRFEVQQTCGLSDIISFSSAKPTFEILSSDWITTQNGPFDEFKNRVKMYKNSELNPESEGTAATIDNIYSVDRTNPTILKIIKLPYAPFELIYRSGRIEVPDYLTTATINWGSEGTTINKQYLKVKPDKTGAFQNQLGIDATVFENLFTQINNTDLRNDENESKLYHSDYYQNKFVYDSFEYPIQLENISEQTLNRFEPDTTLDVNFVTTSTINSRFLFDFRNTNDLKKTQAYDNILCVDRNNEIPIFNSEYLNYINNGQNYDRKAKNLSNVQNAISIGSGLINTAIGITGFGAGLGKIFGDTAAYQKYVKGFKKTKTRKEPLEYKKWKSQYGRGGLSSENALSSLYASGQFASGFGQVLGGISNIIQSERDYAQKQEQMKRSSVTVEGSDDIDLLSYYSENKAKICEFKTTEKMKENVADLFYYYGYVANLRKVPVLNTRKWFNYIQCDAELNNLKNLDQIYIDDLVERYAEGVTVLHEVDGNWDFDQIHANNEVWLNI